MYIVGKIGKVLKKAENMKRLDKTINKLIHMLRIHALARFLFIIGLL